MHEPLAEPALPPLGPLPDLGAGFHALPIPPTSFIGRDAELAVAARELAGTRLLTLTGPPGIGKTRLALHLATDLRPSFPDGVWLVELATLRDARLVPHRVAAVLGVRETPALGVPRPAAPGTAGTAPPESAPRPILEALIEYLRPRRALLVLDSCEHLVAACAALVESLLAACPQLAVLTTSREALGSPDEAILRLAPLALPAAAPDADPGQAPAVRLFVDRARAAQPAFKLTPPLVPAVTQVCRRLDGIPLAIELAAVRLQSLPLDQLAARLDDRFALLTGPPGASLPRHQTLQATFDWSHDLLEVAERVVFRRLAVLAGPWTAETAAAICTGEGLDADTVRSGLAQLVRKSLVLEEPGEGAPVYRWLETIRQYAWDQLEAAGELQWARNRHLACFLRLAEAAAPQLRGATQAAWLGRLEVEHDNLRAALGWALAEEKVDAAARLSGALWGFWYAHSHLSEGRRWLEAVLAAGGALGPVLRAQVLNGAGVLAYMQGARMRAVARLDESLTLLRPTGDKAAIAGALNSLAAVVQDLGDYPRAVALLEESLALKRQLGDGWGTAASLGNLGLVAQEQGDYPRAQTLLRESLALFRTQEDTLGIANTLSNLGSVALAQGDIPAALQLCREGLALWAALGDKAGIAQTLEQLADAAGAGGQAEHAARLWGAVTALCAAIGAPLPTANPAHRAQAIAAARAHLPAGAFEAAWAAGAALPLAQVLAEATAPSG